MNKKNGIKLFVGGIDPETTGESLKSYFEMFTVVVHSKVEVGKKLKLPKGYGYVTVPDMRAVNRILGQDHHIDGKKVDVEIAKGKSKNGKPAQDLTELIKKEALAISNLPTNETKREDRTITSPQNHNGCIMKKYLQQPSKAQSKPIHSKMPQQQPSSLCSQIQSRGSVYMNSAAIGFDIASQRHVMSSYHKSPQGMYHYDTPQHGDFTWNSRCLGQQTVRHQVKVTEALRCLNHHPQNVRINPTGSIRFQARGRW